MPATSCAPARRSAALSYRRFPEPPKPRLCGPSCVASFAITRSTRHAAESSTL